MICSWILEPHGGSDEKGVFQITRWKPSAEFLYSFEGFLFHPPEISGAKTSERQGDRFATDERLLLNAINSQCFEALRKEEKTAESVYKIIELVGSSPNSWEEAAKNAVAKASKTLRDLRIAEILEFDLKIEDGKVTAYRTRVNLSFKYEGE